VSEENNLSEVETQLWLNAAAYEGVLRANAYVAISRISYEGGKFKESLALCETAREIYEQENVSEHQREIFDVNVGISRNYEKLNRLDEAAKALGPAIEAAKVLDIEELDDLLREQGRHWFIAGEYENSIACHQAAIDMSQMNLGDNSFELDYFNIGMGLYELGRYEESKNAYLKARAAFKEIGEVIHVVDCNYQIAENYVQLKNPVEIIHYGQKALDFYTLVDDHRKIWSLKYFLGVAQQLLGEIDSATLLLEEAKQLAVVMGWKEWQFLIKVDTALAELYETNGFHDQAVEILRRVKSVEEIVAKDAIDEAA